jgi:hypothetical protein
MESIRHFQACLQLIGEAERANIFGRQQNSQAVRLKTPEIIIFQQMVHRLLHHGEAALVEPRLRQLGERLLGKLTQLGMADANLLRQRCRRQVDRHASI